MSCSSPARLKIDDSIAIAPPGGWRVIRSAQGSPSVRLVLERPVGGGATVAAHATITIEPHRDENEALRRLGEIAAERPVAPAFATVGGWPALERRYTAPLAVPLADELPEPSWPHGQSLRTTTAVAVGARVIRVEGAVAAQQPTALADTIERVARTMTVDPPHDAARVAQQVSELRTAARRPSPAKAPPGAPTPHAGGQPGSANLAVPDASEIAIAVSANGQYEVIATNSGYVSSQNFGVTFSARSNIPETPFAHDGDPSVGWGPSGAFYHSFIGYPNGENSAVGSGYAATVYISSDDGGSFSWLSHAIICPRPLSAPGSCFPDYPQLAVDRRNQAGGADQIYVVARNLTAGFAVPTIACSADGGKSWPVHSLLGGGQAADWARPSVGSDGAVYVVYLVGSNIMLDRFTSCASGFTLQSTSMVASGVTVTCPIPGLDLCELDALGIWVSPVVAVDDTDSKHVYVAFATPSGPSSDDVLVRDSLDGGQTWTGLARANADVSGRRYMPWVCSVAGAAQVAWYDRRAATATENDLTAYYRATVGGRGATLAAVSEATVSMAQDPQCAGTWPCQTSQIDAAESCSTQPQLAGYCSTPDGGAVPTRCDFDETVCPAGRTCQANTSSSCRPYGDFTADACAAGRVYNAWSSRTPPPGTTAPAGVNVYSAVTIVGTSCGEEGEPCCPGNVCNTSRLECISFSRSLPQPTTVSVCQCGKQGQPCCGVGHPCESGLACSAQHRCTFTPRPVPCGQLGEPCCRTGSPCVSSLRCSDGRCGGVAPAPCRDCTQAEAACKAGCAGDSSCVCECENALCRCEQTHSCPTRCTPRHC